MTSPTIALRVYTDFDSTMVLTDTGNSILAHQMGHKELDRIDRLPETEPGRVSIRKAEDMKWDHLRLSVKEAADILVSPEDNILRQQEVVSTGVTNGTTTDGFNKVPFDDRQQHSEDTVEEVEALNDKYRIRLDPGFRQFHAFCQEHGIPITVVSIGIQPLIEEMLDRYLGVNHNIIVRANGLIIRPDGTWRILWRDSSPYGVEKGRALREARANDLQNPTTDKILWCGDGSSDFPAALCSDIVLARQDTSLEKLCRANSISHRSFVTFETVQEVAQDWLDQQQELSTTMSSATTNGGGAVEP
ncbi:hypothetical protein EC957_002581 [Mortierella hygrophila]|uniref:Uncharacterized protein n=1 Tax=Mortierella hygrophila TaxID=979708 RepID=A0A9P6K119_9FUNG|nr:hypothetical protein EC957_002581 [Mortierella hygrophila]